MDNTLHGTRFISKEELKRGTNLDEFITVSKSVFLTDVKEKLLSSINVTLEPYYEDEIFRGLIAHFYLNISK